MDGIIWAILAGVVFLAVGLAVGYAYRKNIAEKKIGRAEETVGKLIEDAQKKQRQSVKKQCSKQKKRSID